MRILTNYYAFAGRRFIGVSTKLVDARRDVLDVIFGKMIKGKVCSDPKGKNVIEYMRCVSADLPHSPDYRSPIQAKRAGTDKWRDVTADGTIC